MAGTTAHAVHPVHVIEVSEKGPRVLKKPNLHTNELNTTFFCSTKPLKASNRLGYLKLVMDLFLVKVDLVFSLTYLLEFELFVNLKRFKTFNTTVCVYFQFFSFF
jgi:hypothetical protein